MPYNEKFGVNVKVFDPVEIDGNYYVDGCLRDNTPIKPILDRHQDVKTVIVVYLKLDKLKREANRLAANCAGVSLVEIVPTEDIEKYTSSITEKSVRHLISLGRTDTHAVLKKSGLVSVEKPLVIADDLIGETNKENLKVKLGYEKHWMKNLFKVEIPESLLDAVKPKIVLMDGTNDVLQIDENVDERTSVPDETAVGIKIATLTFPCRQRMLTGADSVRFVFEHKYCPVEITYTSEPSSDVQSPSKGRDTLYVSIRIKIASDERDLSQWRWSQHKIQ